MTINDFVDMHVIYNINGLVDELSQNDAYRDTILDAMYDECIADFNLDVPELGAYTREAMEYWLVSDWLASQLEKRNGLVLRDFFGINVWGRETSGSAIAEDYLIKEIYNDTIKS